jgi:hypothetical protein
MIGLSLYLLRPTLVAGLDGEVSYLASLLNLSMVA